ncbi:MAG: acyl carrier protein [Pseudomonadota bacterium]
MYTKESVYDHLTKIFVDLFEIDADKIHPGALLVDDLDIDSIDAVDMAVELQELSGSKIQPEQFRDIRTVEDVVNAVLKIANEEPA